VTASDSKLGAIQLRDIDEVDKENGTAVVVDKCTLKDKLKAELRWIKYSGYVDDHVCHFSLGIIWKRAHASIWLCVCGNAWKFEFDSEDNIPSTLKLKHSKGSLTVPVVGSGKILKK
jgi:hypothetical protein